MKMGDKARLADSRERKVNKAKRLRVKTAETGRTVLFSTGWLPFCFLFYATMLLIFKIFIAGGFVAQA